MRLLLGEVRGLTRRWSEGELLKVTCVLAVLSLLPAASLAIDAQRSIAQLHHTAWTARDGAPTDIIAMTQTEDGFLWLATGSGLVRFDGAQFERYAPAPGEVLPAASIRSLLAVPGNGLWLGWVFGGVTLLLDGHLTTFGESEGYPPGTTVQFLRDSDGVVWAATTSGLARFDGHRWERIGAQWNVAGERALSLFRGRDDTLWLFTNTTLMSLPKGTRSFVGTGGTSSTRTPIVQAPDGTLYLSDGRGIRLIPSLAQYERSVRRLLLNPPTENGDKRFIVDRDGALWFATMSGLGRIAQPQAPETKTEYFTKADGLTDSFVFDVFEDRQGSIWVATSGGVDQFRLSTFVPPTGVMQASYPAMLPGTDGGLWFAALDSDLQHLTPEGAITSVKGLFVTSAYRDPNGVDWYGSQPRTPAIAELIRRDRDQLQRVAMPANVPPEDDIQAITMDANGALWVSVIRKGVYKLVNNAWTQPPELPDNGKLAAITLTTDSLGRVWLGYPANRLARWENGTARVFSASDGLDVGNVLVIREHGRHLWIAGDHGVALLESSRLRSMLTTDATVLRGITGVVETNDGDLWLLGIPGAVRIAATEIQTARSKPGYRMAFRLFDDDDGLYGVPTDIRPLPTLVEGNDGRLWFGTNRGVFALDPRRIVTNEVPPTIVLTDLHAGVTRYEPHTALRLPAHSTAVQFDYTATNLAIARRAHFQYRLDGVDADWQDAGARREAFYTNLGPGQYRFHLKASNENGVWSPEAVAAEFTILPAWYQTNWFNALCVAAGITMLVLMYRMRFAQVRSQLQGRLQERTLERERIARELHDTLLQSFQGIVLLFGATIQRLPSEHPTRDLMSRALVRANEVLGEARDRVSGLRNSQDLPNDLPAALEQAAHDLLHVQPVEFAMSVTGLRRTLHAVVMEEAYQIGREALANAQRHANAQHIRLEVTFGARRLQLRVQDDGNGFDAEILQRKAVAGHWGIPGMRERADKLSAKLSIRSQPGGGTEVDLQIPATVAYRHQAERPGWRRFFFRGNG